MDLPTVRSDADRYVYRAPMRGAVDRALELGVVGVGGRLDAVPVDFADAVARTDRLYDERTARRLERFAAVPDLSFVWTRSADGGYFLGQIDGPWRYDASASDMDLVNVRPCRWVAVPEHRVPAATVRTFARGGRNFQQTHDANVGRLSAEIWTVTHSNE
ncbi:GAF domain-containing protein [Rhodococcus sp. B10]|uniref:GAF domain-containing protein n=1 Tax=Rhodococcus sp. B10 TaxID=2695876 RepID=UPI0016BC8463|nr:GAF domain-containing protein [Rhodococcus sp. B10]NIL75886.1 hypothetical protein [Rhodococcus sp. B10]